MRITEIFESIEGEGRRTGYPVTFVRLAGCNLRCSYCDTPYSLSASDATMELSPDELKDEILKRPWKKVTITGGEPLLQTEEVMEMVKKVLYRDIEFNIETNGAVALPEHRTLNVFYTMDWKSPSSGCHDKMKLENLYRLTSKDVLKFVVGNKTDLEDMKKTVEKLRDFHSHIGSLQPEYFVSPIFGEIEPVEIVEYIKANKLREVRMQIQLHKIVWNPNKRGV